MFGTVLWGVGSVDTHLLGLTRGSPFEPLIALDALFGLTRGLPFEPLIALDP